MDINITLLLWIVVFSNKYGQINSAYTGVNIGYSCKCDAECTAGNGGEYSKCNQVVSICICTINHLGEDKCRNDSDKYIDVCRRSTLDQQKEQCTLECSPEGTREWRENEDWYGETKEDFAPFIHDKKTSVCYDPRRALNSVPDGFEIKQSTIPNAGLGAFTNVYTEQHTLFGPYKGILDINPDTATESGYSWTILENNSRVVFVDAKDSSLSNWLRYFNTPTSVSMENIVGFQYEGDTYYRTIKNIQPGTELFIWYGEIYREYLNIEKFDHPRYNYANEGYVGGFCSTDEKGMPCHHDDNTVCTGEICYCVHGTHIRAGMCLTDEKLGGICTGLNGDTCKQDVNAECQRGVCVCKTNTTQANGMCIPDEMFGGRCAAQSGEMCLLDNKTECVNGLCRCRHGASGINGKCIEDETYQGRCDGNDGKVCENDRNAECIDEICVCMDRTSVVNGKCELDEMVGGYCKSLGENSCALDENAICIEGICRCKKEASNIDGICVVDGDVCGVCIKGKCNGQNTVCDPETNTCVCQSSYYSYNGECLKEQNLTHNKYQFHVVPK